MSCYLFQGLRSCLQVSNPYVGKGLATEPRRTDSVNTQKKCLYWEQWITHVVPATWKAEIEIRRIMD
jgi:hypothetical protein